jgi:hypothetical protein
VQGTFENVNLQHEVIMAHLLVVSTCLKRYMPSEEESLVHLGPWNFLDERDTNLLHVSVADGLSTTALQVLEAAGGNVGPALNTTSISALLRKVFWNYSGLRADGNAAWSKEGKLDVMAPSLHEMALVLKPVGGLLTDLEALLDRYPDQPFLVQLRTICLRILGALLVRLRVLSFEVLPSLILDSQWIDAVVCRCIGVSSTIEHSFIVI